MNAAHLHLTVNHLPVIGAALATLLGVLAVWRRDRPGFAWATAIVLLVVGLGAVLAVVTGEAAHDFLEGKVALPHDLLHDHASAGELGMWLSMAGLVWPFVLHRALRGHHEVPGWAAATQAVLALVLTGWFAWVSNLGGLTAHPEIRSDPVSTTLTPPDASSP